MNTTTDVTNLNGARLAKAIQQKVEEFKLALKGVDDNRGGIAPAGRWTPKQIISHLCGPEGVGIIPPVTAYLEEYMPRLDLVIEDPFYTEHRQEMTTAELLEEFDRQYDRLLKVVSKLGPEQLERQARIPVFKDTPLGEYPTLGEYLRGVADFHLGFHTEHLKEVLQRAA